MRGILSRGARSACLAACTMVLGLLLASHSMAQQSTSDVRPDASCSDILEAGLDPATQALALSQCNGNKVGARSDVDAQPIDWPRNTDPWTAGQPPAQACSDLVRSAVQSHPSAAGKGRDLLVLETYGTGRRQKLVLPGLDVRRGCSGCVNGARQTFPLEDQTHRHLLAGSVTSTLIPGRYAAQVLPGDRHSFLLPPESRTGVNTGSAGAVVLWSVDNKDAFPIVIHSGGRDANMLARLPSLLLDPRLMDQLIGSMLALRALEPGPAQASTWQAQAPLVGRGDCRLPMFASFEVEVRPAGYGRFRNWIRSWFGDQYGRPVPHPGPPAANLEPVAMSWERIERAQATAGMTPAQFRELAGHLLVQSNTHSAAIRAALDPGLTAEQRIARLTALNSEVGELIIETTVTLEGLQAALEQPDFQGQDWSGVISALEGSALRLDELLQNEVGPTLSPGDAGGAVASLWLPSSEAPAPRAVCDLARIDGALPPLSVSLPVKGQNFTLRGSGNARYWFVPVPGQQGVFRMNASVRYDTDDLRSLHRDVANHLRPNNSCQERTFLENTDQAVSERGFVALRSQGRLELWHCASFKYICGVSLRGTKSCKKHIKTRISKIGFQRRHRVDVQADGTVIGVALSGPEIASDTGFAYDLERDPKTAALAAMTGLSADRGRFMEFNRDIWLGAELRGDVNLDESLACALASQLRRAP